MITPLPFDTHLFNYPVGKISINTSWNEEDFLIAAKEFQLIYLFSESPVAFNNSSFQLVDIKMIYEKHINAPAEIPEIKHFKSPLSKELQDLAFESGVYSRYKLDTRLNQEEFEKLYRIWIQKAWESNSVLEAPDLQGMVTYSVADKAAKVGLIAVSKESQGKGWGKKLMKFAEAKAFALGAETIEVSTQEANIPACRLYESLGYKLAEKTFVYHWYSDK
ncbi:acetyltransferase (GNAT) family protein [Algoriphagus ratkowskyi]|uniref:Acetyltransferase (GNAT) family protein n=1 Tax=Algoriphagus ratkowskyi TaxID=57028 RepID=A0A2W7QMT2_9BACT|nr:GNAT family N-acetyltransferase [Algoriphagus ratkowskyi]PZX49788.1 acetyltransferase (GNAT) family protein [Algoriphagus ratkowskyi]TXD75492.1 GNAT family N-acetyltransferase [Algoriphagus ratkowskyi]